MLRKGRYGLDHPQRRLTAVLRVVEVFPTHTAGAAWYLKQSLGLPNNCWVHGNPPKPYEQSHRLHKTSAVLASDETHREWDKGYRARAMKFGTFVICERLFHDLSWSAPEVTEAHLKTVFDGIPGTRNPGRWSIKHAEHLLTLLSLDIPLSVQ
jgi:hypothetical protein